MIKRKITYITGGERSGKSGYAQKLALEKTQSPVYLATAKILDNDFEERVRRHQSDRDSRWQTIEEPINLSSRDLSGQVVLLDCITLWLTNIYYKNNTNYEEAFEQAKKEWDKFIDCEIELIVISNELGMGVHAESREIRKFVELQGWMNQYIAASCDEAWLIVSGIPVKIK